MILDDDDTIVPDCLSGFLVEFNKSSSDTGAIYCQTNIIDEEIANNEIVKFAERDNPFQREFINIFSLLKDTRFTPIAYMFKREVFNRIGNFNESEDSMSQWEFWLKLISSTEVSFVDKVLVSWHNRVSAEGYDKNLIHTKPESLMDSYKEKFIQRKISGFSNDNLGHCALLFLATSAALKDASDNNIYSMERSDLLPASGSIRSFMGKLLRKVTSQFNRG